jgi:hypothetical protein
MIPRLLLTAVAAAATFTGAAGCAEEVTAPPPSGGTFTLWGALDPVDSLQAIRVIAVTDILEPQPGPLDATVTSTDLRNGAVTTWRDSIVTFSNGTTGHVFVAMTDIDYNGVYRIDVVRSDGASSRARVTVPPLVEAFLETDENGSPDEAALWPGVPQLNAPVLTLRIQDSGCGVNFHDVEFREISGAVAEPFEFGWRTQFSLARLREVLPTHLANGALLQITLRAEVASVEWRFPTDNFDPEILIEPGAFTNVEGGFGFIGAAYPAALTYVPDTRATTRAGFPNPGFCVP